jgi:hypothetical protein
MMQDIYTHQGFYMDVELAGFLLRYAEGCRRTILRIKVGEAGVWAVLVIYAAAELVLVCVHTLPCRIQHTAKISQ